MNKTKNIHNKNKKLIVASIAIVVAFTALFASPIVAMDDAFATKKKKGNVVLSNPYLNHKIQFKMPCVLRVEPYSYHVTM